MGEGVGAYRHTPSVASGAQREQPLWISAGGDEQGARAYGDPPTSWEPTLQRGSGPARQGKRWRALHIRDVGVFGVFVALFAMALRPVVDPDLFWHLATGRYIWTTGRIPHADPFSWTAYGRAWIAHEWLTETILYPLYTHGGYAALMLVFASVITAAFAVAYATARLLGASRPVALLVTLVAAVASDHTWGVRPQMLSLLLTALAVWILTRARLTGRPRTLWALPPLMVVWVNLHGGFIFGLVIIGLYAFAYTCEVMLTPHPRPLSLKGRGEQSLSPSPASGRGGGGVRALWRVFAVSLAACLVNPNGLKGLIYPFTYLGNNASTRYVAEWVSPDFHQGHYQVFEALILALVVGVSFSPRRPRFVEVLLAILFTYLALSSVRNINLFSIVVAPLVAVYLSYVWRRLRRQARVALESVSAEVTDSGTACSDSRHDGPALESAWQGMAPKGNTIHLSLRLKPHGKRRRLKPRRGGASVPVVCHDTSGSGYVPPYLNGIAPKGAMGAHGGLKGFRPFRVRALPWSFRARQRPAAGRRSPGGRAALNLALAVVIAGATLIVSAPGLTARHNEAMQARRFPAGAVAYMRRRHLSGRLLNSYDWGGYLIWTLPRERVYVDGRPDMYGDHFMDAFMRVWQAQPGWQATLRRQGVRLVLVEPSSGLGRALAGARGWRVAYHDKLSVLYARA